MIRTMMKVGLLGYRTRFKTLHMMLVLVSCGDMMCMVICRGKLHAGRQWRAL